jgi:hypothetical protein
LPRSKLIVVLAAVVSPPTVRVPIVPTPPGAIVLADEPFIRVPLMVPTVPLANVALLITLPVPVPDPVVLATDSVPKLTRVVPE